MTLPCSVCRRVLPLDCFTPSRRRVDTGTCRECVTARWRRHYDRLAAIPDGALLECTRCQTRKPKPDFYPAHIHDSCVSGICLSCHNVGRRHQRKAKRGRRRVASPVVRSMQGEPSSVSEWLGESEPRPLDVSKWRRGAPRRSRRHLIGEDPNIRRGPGLAHVERVPPRAPVTYTDARAYLDTRDTFTLELP